MTCPWCCACCEEDAERCELCGHDPRASLAACTCRTCQRGGVVVFEAPPPPPPVALRVVLPPSAWARWAVRLAGLVPVRRPRPGQA